MTSLRQAVFVLIALLLLTAATGVTSGYYHRTRERLAEEHFATGQALLAQGNRDRAVVELRAALSLRRGDPEYALVLAAALLDAGSPREASTHLDEAMAADPTSGRANLIRARIARALDDSKAAMYYQRAFFGSWPPPLLTGRVEAGFELVEYLIARGDDERARAALAQLAAETRDDAPRSVRIAHLLHESGAPAEAVIVARRATTIAPDEAAAWAALADAAFAAGDDETAADAAKSAERLDRANPRWAQMALVASRVLALNPQRPRLRATERLRRERALVQLAVTAVSRCLAEGSTPGVAFTEARRELSAPRGKRLDEDRILELATRVWAERPAGCPVETTEDRALARLFARLDANPEGQ